MNAPTLDPDQSDLADLVAALTGSIPRPTDADPAGMDTARRRLADAGLWTLGAPEEGIDPAGDDLAAVVFAGLGRTWPALAWAAVQAHAAVEVLGDRPLADRIRAAEVVVAVVDERSPTVRLRIEGGTVEGSIARVDPAGEQPHVLVLGEGSALLLSPAALRCTPLRRTGLDGAATAAVQIVDPPGEDRIGLVDTDGARVRLRLGAAAVAAGIADAAAAAALTYSGGREQFGAPLTALPTVRDALLDAAAGAVIGLRAVLRPRDCTPWQAAAVLDTACERAIDTCALAVQAHGGYGYLAEYEVERMLRDAVSLRAVADVPTARRSAAAELAAGATGGPR